MEQPILPLRDAPVLADAAAVWFSRRWGIPAESYRESMEQCLRRKAPAEVSSLANSACAVAR